MLYAFRFLFLCSCASVERQASFILLLEDSFWNCDYMGIRLSESTYATQVFTNVD